jgi:hypothetical protein
MEVQSSCIYGCFYLHVDVCGSPMPGNGERNDSSLSFLPLLICIKHYVGNVYKAKCVTFV